MQELDGKSGPDMPQNTLRGRASSGTGPAENLTPQEAADVMMAGTIAAKTAPAAADTLLLSDSAQGNRARRVTIPQIANRSALAANWQLLQEYRNAGTFTWTAPDIFGGGQPYLVGAFIVGGGQSGTVAGNNVTSASSGISLGGASGFTESTLLLVTPGQSYPVVVGAGGARRVIASPNGWIQGNIGGTSSFAGITARGGGDPYWGVTNIGNVVSGVNTIEGQPGAQPTEFHPINNAADSSALYILGTPSPWGGLTKVTGNGMGNGFQHMCINPFTMMRCMAAGGGAVVTTNASNVINDELSGPQPVPTMPDGSRGGIGGYTTSTAGFSLPTTGNATGFGNGGGGLAIKRGGGSFQSGAGSPGAVFIYVRRAA